MCPGKCKKLLSANPVEKLLQKWTTSQGIIAKGTRDPGLQNFISKVLQRNQLPLFNIQSHSSHNLANSWRKKSHLELVVHCCTHNCNLYPRPTRCEVAFSSHFSSIVEFDFQQILVKFQFNSISIK